MEPVTHVNDRHDLRDVLLGINAEEWQKGEGGGVQILAVLWAIWLHRNDKLFNGRVVSTDGVAYAVEGFVAAWSS